MDDVSDLAASTATGAAAEPAFWVALARPATCPVCAAPRPHDGLSGTVLADARAALAGASGQALEYVRCQDCGTVHAPGAAPPRYEDDDAGEQPLRHYLEEGAGIDLMIEPLARIDRAGIRQYAEIGCAFGFSLDVARRHFGWEVRGIDPSPLAAAGRDALGLPIEQRYFTEAAPLAPPRADLLQAAEVIEHVTDPHAFMRGLVSSLAERGILVVSTPNAALLRAGTPDALVFQVLQPGIHLTLFSRTGLVALAEAHGLRHHRIHETADDVTLYAAREEFAFDADATCDRDLYLDYLRGRLPLAPAGTALRRGLMSRLLRELTLRGMFDAMDPFLPDIFAEYRLCGLDLESPGTLAHTDGAPFNVTIILYSLGMRALVAQRDPALGIAYLDAAAAWHARDAARVEVGGVADASAQAVADAAAFQAMSARVALDPEGEHDRFLAAGPAATMPSARRQRLFAELVNRGDLTRAAVHFDAVRAVAETFGDTTAATGLAAIGERATACFVLGIFALNGPGDRVAARHFLARAADIAALHPTCEATRYAAVIALHRAADPVEPPAEFFEAESARPSRAGRWLGRLTRVTSRIDFADLSETPDPALLPPLDQPGIDLGGLTPEQRAWWRDGVLILPKFVPDPITEPYIRRRAGLDSPGGWVSGVPYLQVPELSRLALFPPLMRMLEHLIGEPMVLHLALSGWISTQRNWHQDDYLNPPFVNGWYAAVWIALDRIAPDSGPFEYVPGSHRWPLLRGEKVRAHLTDEERGRKQFGVNHWPKYSERFVVPAIEAEIARRRTPPRTFLGERGDVLIWHGRLMHRGTLATTPGRERRSLITHYSGTNHRPDMTIREHDSNGQEYAVFDVPLH